MTSYVDRFLNQLDQVNDQGDGGWIACCPVLGHGADWEDSHPSLIVSIGEDGKIIFHCRVGCSSEDVLNAMDLTWSDLWPSKGEEPFAPLVEQLIEEEDLFLRHRIYSRLLSRMTLLVKHQKDLSQRGFCPQEMFKAGYRSLDSKSLIALYQDLGDEIYQVPGIKRGDQGPEFSPHGSSSGIVIPCRDPVGNIRALKVRKDEPCDGNKYYYLTHLPFKLQAPVHCPYYPILSSKELWITEGEFKAEYIVRKKGKACISIPGVAQWKKALPYLDPKKTQQVVLAFDYPELDEKLGVLTALKGLKSAIEDRYSNMG